MLLCLLVTALAGALLVVEVEVAGQAYLEALVLAILLGVVVHTASALSFRWYPGVTFSARVLLEVAVVLLGGTVLVVAVAIAASYSTGRLLGLLQRMAILVACCNSICGNSAIAAVAPVIGADGDDIASSIAFSAVLGVVVVLLLPLLVPVLLLSLTQYGVLAGLTVYAVSQVLAATLPIGTLSNQVGTVVKLVRVLMLGPVVLGLSLLTRRLRDETDEPAPVVTTGDRPACGGPALHELVPWFIVGFLVVLVMRSMGIIPAALLPSIKTLATLLTTMSMAALGLGLQVMAAVTPSLGVLDAISLALIRLLGIA